MDNFVLEHLTDNTDDLILSDADKRKEIIDTLSTKKSAKKRKATDALVDDTEPQSAEDRVAKVQQNFEIWKQGADEDAESRPKAKPSLSDQDLRRVEAYDEYRLMKVDDLRTILRWNRQIISGTRSVLLVRVLDGHMYGRLGSCLACREGKLRLEDDGSLVHCQGTFDEATRSRYACSVKFSPEMAPRMSGPWFQNKPTDEQEAEMEQEKGSTKSIAVIEDTKASLSVKALNIEWDLSSNDGLKKAAADLLGICQNSGNPMDLPNDPKAARMEVGKVIMENKDKSAEQVLQLLVDRFGLKTVKEVS